MVTSNSGVPASVEVGTSGQRRHVLLAGDHVAFDGARLDIGRRSGGGIAIDVDVAGDDVIQRGPAALVVDRRELGIGGAHEHGFDEPSSSTS